MRPIYLFLLFITISLGGLFAQEPVQVAVLGTYHFANPGLDAANIQADDVKTDKRQAELEALAEALANFKPTKIAVEASYENQTIPAKYEAFLEHGMIDSLRRNELFQIGFRVAALLEHPTIYPIDHRMSLDPETMPTLMEENPECMAILNNRISSIQDSLNYWTEQILYKGTITDFLRFMNQPASIAKNHDIYLDFTRDIYSKNSYAGAEMLAKWYERNIMIFQNLTRITDFDRSGERILIVFGQGHAKILKDLVQDSDYYELVDVLPYLE